MALYIYCGHETCCHVYWRMHPRHGCSLLLRPAAQYLSLKLCCRHRRVFQPCNKHTHNPVILVLGSLTLAPIIAIFMVEDFYSSITSQKGISNVIVYFTLWFAQCAVETERQVSGNNSGGVHKGQQLIKILHTSLQVLFHCTLTCHDFKDYETKRIDTYHHMTSRLPASHSQPLITERLGQQLQLSTQISIFTGVAKQVQQTQ